MSQSPGRHRSHQDAGPAHLHDSRHLLAPPGLRHPRGCGMAVPLRPAARLAAGLAGRRGRDRRARLAPGTTAGAAWGGRGGLDGRHPVGYARPRAHGPSVKAADLRVPHARVFVVFAALMASAGILWLARGYTFYFDEWTFLLPAYTGLD